MSLRPAIPLEVRREILFESQHQCAVCCHALSIEMAHIIPWHKTRNNHPANLIALCPNCHSLADKEGWSEKYFRMYKNQPCASRRPAFPVVSAEKRAIIDLIIATEPEDITEKERRRIIYMLAAYLDIPSGSIEIKSIEPENSSKLTIEMPQDKVATLRNAIEKSDARLEQMMERHAIIRIQYSERPRELLSNAPQGPLLRMRVGIVGFLNALPEFFLTFPLPSSLPDLPQVQRMLRRFAIALAIIVAQAIAAKLLMSLALSMRGDLTTIETTIVVSFSCFLFVLIAIQLNIYYINFYINVNYKIYKTVNKASYFLYVKIIMAFLFTVIYAVVGFALIVLISAYSKYLFDNTPIADLLRNRGMDLFSSSHAS